MSPDDLRETLAEDLATLKAHVCCYSEAEVDALLDRVRADAARTAWDACVAKIRKCAPGCTDQCDQCDLCGDVLDDLDENPYTAEVSP